MGTYFKSVDKFGEEQYNGALVFTGTNTPASTGNTATSLGIASIPAIYINSTTGAKYYVDATGVSTSMGTTPNVTFGTTVPTGTANEGDEYFITSNGTSTGTISAQYIYDATSSSWVLRGGTSTSFKHLKEWHVDPNGNDTTGTGAEDNPYLTIGKALLSAGNSGEKVIVHPGTYAENITLSQLNLDLIGETGTTSGVCYIQGTVTVTTASSSSRLTNLMIDNVVFTGTGSLVMNEANVKYSLTKSGAGYLEVLDSDITGINITGAGQANFYGGKQAGLVINNTSAVVAVDDSRNLSLVTVTTGTLGILESNVFATSSGGTAITAAAGTVVVIKNSSIYDTVGAATKVTLSGSYSVDDVYFNKTSSTLGTNLYLVDWFDNIGLINVPTITTATKALVRDSNGVVSEQTFPTGGGAWYTGTNTPAATGNTAASLGVTSLPAFYKNTTTGNEYYIDSTGVANLIYGSTAFSQVVYVNATSPSTATIFDTANPPVTNNNALKNLTNAIYIGTNGSTWTSNGTTYSTYTAPSTTEWYFANTTTDAAGNYANSIYRTGWLGLNTNNPLSAFDIASSYGVNILSSTASAYTLLSTDSTVVMKTAASVATLPTSVNRRIYNVKNGSTSNITVTGSIDGITQTITIPAGQSRTFHGDGTTWWII